MRTNMQQQLLTCLHRLPKQLRRLFMPLEIVVSHLESYCGASHLTFLFWSCYAYLIDFFEQDDTQFQANFRSCMIIAA